MKREDMALIVALITLAAVGFVAYQAYKKKKSTVAAPSSPAAHPAVASGDPAPAADVGSGPSHLATDASGRSILP